MYKFIVTGHFKKHLKKICKKDREIKQSVRMALLTFNERTSIYIGHGIFKLRIKGLGKGKSGGYRLFVFLVIAESLIVPICIYAKNEMDNITVSELNNHLDAVTAEINQNYLSSELE